MREWYAQFHEFAKSKKGAPFVDIMVFVIITVLVHKLWWHYSAFIYALPGFIEITGWLAHKVFLLSSWINMKILCIDMQMAPGNTLVFLKNNSSIFINESCSGFKQMVQIVILFVLFPGPWKHKLWFIPACIVGMFFVNIIRVIGLSYAMIWSPEHWDFIHLWIMRPVYYLAIFIMWVIWIEKFKNHKAREKR